MLTKLEISYCLFVMFVIVLMRVKHSQLQLQVGLVSFNQNFCFSAVKISVVPV